MHMESPHTQGQRKLMKGLEDDVHKKGNKIDHILVSDGNVFSKYCNLAGRKGPSSNNVIMVDEDCEVDRLLEPLGF